MLCSANKIVLLSVMSFHFSQGRSRTRLQSVYTTLPADIGSDPDLDISCKEVRKIFAAVLQQKYVILLP